MNGAKCVWDSENLKLVNWSGFRLNPVFAIDKVGQKNSVLKSDGKNHIATNVYMNKYIFFLNKELTCFIPIFNRIIKVL